MADLPCGVGAKKSEVAGISPCDNNELANRASTSVEHMATDGEKSANPS
jgi:hypothetical protein